VVLLLEWVVFATSFAVVFLAVLWVVERKAASAGARIRSYLLLDGMSETAAAKDEIGTFAERVWLPMLRGVGMFVQKLTPVGLEKRMEALLQKAGHPFGMSGKEYMGWSSLLLGLGLLGGTLMGVQMPNPRMALLVVLAIVGITVLLPRMMLKSRIKERQQKIKFALPDTLDLLTVSVEAGLGFDQALAKVVEKTDGPLAIEFRQALQEIQVGKVRRDALKDLGERTGVEAMIKFVNALVQADKLGVGIGKVLRVQAEDLRSHRRQEAEEKAMKAPIKMLFPLIFFIFPSLFVIILGPAVISLMKMFQSF
jgi:tight adherence protein C